MEKKAIITGVTGQDGSYLARFLLSKNYIVHGIKRRTSLINTYRIDDLINNSKIYNKFFFLHYGDLTDASSIQKIINFVSPDEIYNLAAQSHVSVSFDQPEYTANSDGLGVLRVLECIKNSKKKIKFYQASTSELFGLTNTKYQNEKTPFYPRSPYAAAKLFAHWLTINYREAYKIFACNGILFNHESPLRGETFITRKVIIGLCKIKLKKQKEIIVGNLYAKRDWGHAKDYVKAMWMMMQKKIPDDYVIATGKQYSVKDLINHAAKELKIKITWKGTGINEKGYDENNKIIVRCHKKYFRPTEVFSLLGDCSKAKKELLWQPETKFKDLIKEMVHEEMKSQIKY
jgi:GDPmannose 4,6-dehydratase